MPLRRTRYRLAFRTEITAPASDNHTPDSRATPVTALALAPIRSMLPLIFPRLPLRVTKVGNRRPASQNCLAQYILQDAPQHLRLLLAQCDSPPHWMNLRAPQTLIRINIADAPQYA